MADARRPGPPPGAFRFPAEDNFPDLAKKKDTQEVLQYLFETCKKGDLVAFMRTADLDDHTAVARSTDHGKSFQPWQDTGFQGHPHYALRLPDKRVLLVYGYRHPPFGVRARILDPECTNAAGTATMMTSQSFGLSLALVPARAKPGPSLSMRIGAKSPR